MKRIDIYYGGDHFSVGGRRLDDMKREIESGLAGGAHWLEVNDGEGMKRTAFLLITPGVPLAIVPVPGEDEYESGPRPLDDPFTSLA